MPLKDAAGEFGDVVGWGQVPGLWYASALDYVVVALALGLAYSLGAGGPDGLARRTRAAPA